MIFDEKPSEFYEQSSELESDEESKTNQEHETYQLSFISRELF